MGADVRNIPDERAGDVLADQVIKLMKMADMPNGLSGIGYNDSDIEALTERTLMQKRLLNISPLEISKETLHTLFKNSMRYW